MQLPHSRLQETEADLVGLRLMSKACLDPGSAVKYALSCGLGRDTCVENRSSFWNAMQSSEKGWRLQTDFLQTHPGHRTRARVCTYLLYSVPVLMAWKAIEKWLPEIRERYPCVDTEEFQAAVDFHTSTPISQPDPTPRAPPSIGRPRPRPPSQPQPKPQPESTWGGTGTNGGDWGTSDPWADKNGGGQGSGDWGASDPWADKNRGEKNSW